jgi:hypothetical protein
MRNDTTGFFWDDYVPPKVAKEKIKRTPPERTWELPDYLPGIEEARAYVPQLLTDEDWIRIFQTRQPLVYDTEIYPNYFCVTFTDPASKRCWFLELHEGTNIGEQWAVLSWIIRNNVLVGFNNLRFDKVILAFVLAGYGPDVLKQITNALILENARGSDLYKAWGFEPVLTNEIDLIEVAPLQGSLKAYGGRLHCDRMMDLPFHPDTVLTEDQKLIVRWYNGNDNAITIAMWDALSEQIKLRERISIQYGVDVRSKSDAQIAEAVISAEIYRRTGVKPRRPDVGQTWFHFQHVPYLQFQTPQLQQVYNTILQTPFTTDEFGVVVLPEAINQRVELAGRTYQMGIGGLHSNEQKLVRFRTPQYRIFDRDVTSYYPKLILNQHMYPAALGPEFLVVYNGIVVARVTAKEAKDIITANSLKIVANGTFGKTGSPYSIIYAPQMMIQVTVGGQLSILLLIERMVLAGFEVLSANTDGILIYCPVDKIEEYLAIIKQWEKDTQLPTEEAEYLGYFARDVNNYVAVKAKGGVKAKGAYLDPWAEPDLAIFRFHKNPVNLICTEAVHKYVQNGTHPSVTIGSCSDIRRFVTVRNVRGGAVKDGQYLGKTIRWYYAQGEAGEIVAAMTGNKVPRSDGAKPCMVLPNGLPSDLDLDWYIREADDMIQELGLASTL